MVTMHFRLDFSHPLWIKEEVGKQKEPNRTPGSVIHFLLPQ